jgi:hypothetical protein
MNKLKLLILTLILLVILSCNTGKKVILTGNVTTYTGLGFYRIPLEYEITSEGESISKSLNVLILPNGKIRGKLKLNDSIKIKAFSPGGLSCVPAVLNKDININETGRKVDLGNIYLYNRPDLSVRSENSFSFFDLRFELLTDIEDLSYYTLTIYDSSNDGSQRVDKVLEIAEINTVKFEMSSIDFEESISPEKSYFSENDISYTFFKTLQPGYYMVRADIYKEVDNSIQLISYSGVNFFEIRAPELFPNMTQE